MTDEEFFDALECFAGPVPEMEWTMTDEEYERRCIEWWTAQKRERKKREETREERLDRLCAFYHNEENELNERSPFDD